MAALATGVILASDVFESGAAVDRLLFGTLLGLDTADLVLSARSPCWPRPRALALGRTWSAVGFDPDGARALGLPTGRADLLLLALVAVAAVAAIPAVGALLVTAIYVLPAAAARMLTGSIRGLVACALALALAEGVIGLYLAYWLDVPAGPPVAVLGATGVPACSRPPREVGSVSEPAVTVEQLAAGYGGVPVLEHVSLEARPGSRSACSARTAAARRPCFACCSASSSPRPAASSSAAGRHTWRRPSARGSTSRSPRSTWR